MTHPHARLSALVDGELDHESRDRMLAHLAHCEECRVAADEERRIKALLSGMPAPKPSDDFRTVLLGLATTDLADGPTADAASSTGLATSARTLLVRRRRTGIANGGLPVARGVGWSTRRPPRRAESLRPDRMPLAAPLRRRVPEPRRGPNQQGPIRRPVRPVRAPQRRIVVGVAGLAAMAGLAVAAAFVAGGQATRQAPVVSPAQRYSVEHAGTVSDLPLSDPGAVTAVLERGRVSRTTGR